MNETPMTCAICGCIIDDNDMWECENCGRIVCGYCIDSEGLCDDCHDEFEEKFKSTHGFMW
jgi:hypothetical protein|nr:MAG TPA: hypothetical protein [Caudoviricetes sp.]